MHLTLINKGGLLLDVPHKNDMSLIIQPNKKQYQSPNSPKSRCLPFKENLKVSNVEGPYRTFYKPITKCTSIGEIKKNVILGIVTSLAEGCFGYENILLPGIIQHGKFRVLWKCWMPDTTAGTLNKKPHIQTTSICSRLLHLNWMSKNLGYNYLQVNLQAPVVLWATPGTYCQEGVIKIYPIGPKWNSKFIILV